MSKVLNQTFKEICGRQLAENQIEVVEMYEKACQAGMSEERALDYLAFLLECYTRSYTIQKEKTSSWRDYLKEVTPIFHVPGEYLFGHSDERHNLRKINRRYGKIRSGSDRLREERLRMEGHLLVLNELFDLSSREAAKLLHVVINQLFCRENHRTYDYTDYTSERVLGLADHFAVSLNPYLNSALYEQLSTQIDLADPRSFDDLFQNMFLCLASILDELTYYEKNSGKNAYFHMASRVLSVDDLIQKGIRPFYTDKTIEAKRED